jgi:hypothetical protein
MVWQQEIRALKSTGYVKIPLQLHKLNYDGGAAFITYSLDIVDA